MLIMFLRQLKLGKEIFFLIKTELHFVAAQMKMSYSI